MGNTQSEILEFTSDRPAYTLTARESLSLVDGKVISCFLFLYELFRKILTFRFKIISGWQKLTKSTEFPNTLHPASSYVTEIVSITSARTWTSVPRHTSLDQIQTSPVLH